ncbi:hypothetical protein ACOJBO_02180 [Rhizobium beringeri]
MFSGQLGHLIDAMRKARVEEARLDPASGLEGAIENNGDALAALRRISRESMVSSNSSIRLRAAFSQHFARARYTHVVISSAENH